MNAIAAALNWIQAVMLGTVATSVAVIAVASVGFMMLQGRVDYRRAGQVIIGCFILFGASSVAGGLQSLVYDASPDGPPSAMAAAPEPPPPLPVTPVPQPDPYAGAALIRN